MTRARLGCSAMTDGRFAPQGRIDRVSFQQAAALALVGWYLMRKKQVVRPRFPAPIYKSLMCLGCSTQPAS